MRLAGFVALYLAAGVVVYGLFLAARAAVSALARLPGRLPPFGEAPADRVARASVVTRLALALAGPLAIYLLVVVASALPAHSRGTISDETLAIDPVASGPAAAAGLRDGDRIVAVGGRRLERFSEIGSALAAHPGQRVDLIVERGGHNLRLSVTPGGPGSAFEGKLGVLRRAEPVPIGAAFRLAARRPFEALALRLRAEPVRADLSGPVGIVRAVAAAPEPSVLERFLDAAAAVGTSALDTFLLAALFLFPFRGRGGPAPLPMRPPGAPRPWVRCAARIVDLAAFLLVLCAAAVAVNPGLIDAASGSLVLLTLPIEAGLLATWGTTPGKALLAVSVRDASGNKLRFGPALRRAAAVWTFGLAVNQPFGLITGLVSLRRVRRRAVAYWDALDGHQVEHGAIAGWRIAVALTILVALAALAVAAGFEIVTRDY